MSIITVTDSKVADKVCKELRQRGYHDAVLSDLAMLVWRGSAALILQDAEGLPLSIHVSHFNKRKKNIYEPYMNWYLAYTIPPNRRQGLATSLYRQAEAEAIERGCRRVKALAGTAPGVWLHFALDHMMWGRRPEGDIIVDSPLPPHAGLYTAKHVPPTALSDHPMTREELTADLATPLRYECSKRVRMS